MLLDLRDRSGMAVILVTSDLGAMAQICDSVAVMYAGRIVERATKTELLTDPLRCLTYLSEINWLDPGLCCQPTFQSTINWPQCAPACRVASTPPRADPKRMPALRQFL
jgi:ABC-type antimicrobial peptide transport system ATPase subunit